MTGEGDGMVVRRGFQKPPSYYDDRLQENRTPASHFFDVITNGWGAMPDYASQIPPEDRWKIVAYIRALQLSQNASQAEVGGQAVPSQSPEFEEPCSGATLRVPVPSTASGAEPTGERQR